MKKIFTLTVVLTLLQTFGYAQKPCVSVFTGQILDEQDSPLIGATIVLKPTGKGAVSDIDGKFELKEICEGEYQVTVQFLGYKQQVFSLSIAGTTTQTISLRPDVETLHEVLVKEKVAHLETAQNYTVLSGEKLAETAGKTLGESLTEISGVNTVQAGPGIFKPVIHGVHSERVLILNHGIRQEGQQWGSEHAPEIDPFIASNIVVVKDASSIKYGTDALGGVVIVNPADLPEAPGLGGTLNFIGQSNGRSGTVSGLLEGGIKNHDGWGWRVQGTGKRSGDFHAPDYSLTNTGIKELNFSTAMGYHNDHQGFEVFVSHFRTELGILKGIAIGNLDDLITAMEREPPQSTESFSYHIGEPKQKVSHNLVKLSAHTQTENGNWRVQYGFQNNNRKEYDIRRGSLAGVPSINLKLNTHTIEAEWETLHGERNELCIGVNGMYQDNTNIFGTQRIAFIPNYVNFSGGTFGVAKFIRDDWVFDMGARYDHRYYNAKGFDFKNTRYNESLTFANVSVTTGATRQMGPNQSLALNLSSSWRPPHVAELYSLGTHQSAAAIEYGLLLNDTTNEVMNINQVPFKVERAFKGVGTYKRQWRHFQMELSGFANYILNYIYLRPTGITQNLRGTYPYFRYTQTDALFVGADMMAVWDVGKHIKVTPQVSLLRATDVTHNDVLVFIPSNKYEVAFRFEGPDKFALKRFFVESKIKYVERQGRAPRVITPRQIKEAAEQNINLFAANNDIFDFMEAPDGYALLNLSAGFSIDRGKARYDIRVAAENILNTSYREYTNRFRYYADDMGRNFLVSLKCSF
ncbi:MAG: carboxypeptidase-like regulatory domain-containing protein [Cyclobacteriaceae bacterium]|nr:carboxypeptidase-like regulatory domain-containing protein [Cyclobacteriaceae bacterium]MCB0499189.1 carboxypeptidase-like regulatory domain-containing protein [Cyclobacteriaceae bacterium]MCB9237971.1 carboxypeptidase-like regulatory domain-containing protein [Flammeovirgaceae bacterium]MCO5271879.1 carboxypeptidase-like regulatory domain-containing protein [Cyclobacteriaceae bacterium]MCW5901705.1 carboxypeptidase-like regulatory domain-containing protein [Cyclobacteriaceae bacterium]